MTTTFENAKVGDRVYSLVHDKFFVITRIDTECMLQMTITDGMTHRYFDYNGSHGHATPQLYFWDNPTIIAPERPQQAPAVDTLVEVRDGYESWIKRYSAGSFDNGRLVCWAIGCTSHTANNDTLAWKEWRLIGDNV